MLKIGHMGAYPFDFDKKGWEHIALIPELAAEAWIRNSLFSAGCGEKKVEQALKDVVYGNKNYVVVAHLHNRVTAIYRHDFRLYVISYEEKER